MATDSTSDRLIAYLQKELPDFSGSAKLSNILGTHTQNRLLLVEGEKRKLVVKQHMPDVLETFYNVAREFEMLRRFGKAVAYAPKPLLLCTDAAVLGSSFMVMEYVDGQHVTSPTRENYGALIDIMADLHDVDLEKNGLADIGKPKGYRPRLFGVWKERLAAARTHGMPDFTPVEEAIVRLMPPETEDEFTPVHNRLLMENMVFRLNNKERLRGVLDWRTVTTGPAFMDISNSLSHWIEEGDVPSLRLLGTVPDGFSRAEAIARYEERRRKKVPHQAFYLTLGFYRRASETQQRYFDYSKGFAHDDVITRLREAVKGLREMALRAAG